MSEWVRVSWDFTLLDLYQRLAQFVSPCGSYKYYIKGCIHKSSRCGLLLKLLKCKINFGIIKLKCKTSLILSNNY